MSLNQIMKVVGIYALVASLYIVFSDRMVLMLWSDSAVVQRISILKGWGFVIVTALTLAWMLWSQSRREMQRYRALLRHALSVQHAGLHGGAIGTLNLYAVDSDYFGPNELAAIEEITREISFGLRNLERTAASEVSQTYLKRLQEAVYATTAALSKMVELRDPYTAEHERRVGELAVAIAAEMGLNEDMQKGLRVAGAMHDVGKIMVPLELLSKPGSLSRLEYEFIKQHAEQGYQILKDIAFPWPVAEVARQHHERLDGSGYPRGLKGTDIIIEARITAVADVVESMSLQRPYRPRLGVELALQEIERGAGVIYDADAAAACLRLFRDKGYVIAD